MPNVHAAYAASQKQRLLATRKIDPQDLAFDVEFDFAWENVSDLNEDDELRAIDQCRIASFP